jgi:hypothetical protein
MKDVEPSRGATIARFAATPLLSGAVSAKGSGFRQLAPAEAAGFMSVSDDILKRAADSGDYRLGRRGRQRLRGHVVWRPSRVGTDTASTAHG